MLMLNVSLPSSPCAWSRKIPSRHASKLSTRIDRCSEINKCSAAVRSIAPGITHVTLTELGLHDKPEAFVQFSKWNAEAWGSLTSEWLVASCRRKPSLQCSPTNLAEFPQAGNSATGCLHPETTPPTILLSWSFVSCLFMFAHQFQDTWYSYVMAKECDADDIIEAVVMEHFIWTAEWVQFHCLETLDEVIQLAETIWWCSLRAVSILPHLSLSLNLPCSLMLCPSSFSLPTSALWRHGLIATKPVPWDQVPPSLPFYVCYFSLTGRWLWGCRGRSEAWASVLSLPGPMPHDRDEGNGPDPLTFCRLAATELGCSICSPGN